MAAACAMAALLVAAPAYAESSSPWWGLTSGSRPAGLQSGLARSEVQEITFSSEAVFGLKVGSQPVGFFATEPYFAELEGFLPEATAANVQAALEGVYGKGNVEVTAQGAGGGSPFVVRSTGEDVDRTVGALGIEPFFIPLGTADAKVVTEGRPDGKIVVAVENLGDANASGEKSAIRIADALPPKLRALSIEGFAGSRADGGPGTPGTLGPVNCPKEPATEPLECTFAGTLPPYRQIELVIGVAAEPGASSAEENAVSVSGGGASARTLSRPIQMGSETPFGVEDYELIPEEAGGALDTRAGSHPFQLTSVVTLNQTKEAEPAAMSKDLHFKLPPGLVGNPTPFPRCPNDKLGTSVTPTECSDKTIVGVSTLVVRTPFPSVEELLTFTQPVYNMAPRVGEPARFAFKVSGIASVFLDASVRTGGDYGVTVSSENISQLAGLVSAKVTFWGVPGDPRHDEQRGLACLTDNELGTKANEGGPCAPLGETEPPPFLIMPTSCEQPFTSTVEGDSWPVTIGEQPRLIPSGPGVAPPSYTLPGEKLTGCNHLPFAPEISVAPDVPQASTPTGLEVKVHVPQTAALNPEGLAESSLKDTTVTLPEGVTLNPAGGDGLEACSEAQIGFTGVEPASGTDLFTPGLPEPFCPDGSKVGTVEIETPLLPNALKGAVYLATPAPLQEAGMNPFGSLIAMYIVAEDPVSGTLVKLPGEVSLDQATGRIVSTFKNTPELPFENLRLHFFGGERAPLATPPHCGSYTTNASFAPWSGNEPANPTSSFDIATGPHGAPCPGATLPFAPSLAAGTTNINAGSFSSLTTTIGREDGNQDIQSVQLHMPPGLSGALAGVALCPEAQANAGTCGPGSLIGHTIVSVGLGGDPFSVTGGQVFLTEKYQGAPFGLSIVNPANAGPFHLGKVIVRAKIEVDPHTAQLTITTGAIPHILDGIPLQIKHVNVTIDRPGFTFNPTNCNPMSITGSIGSTEGTTSPVSVPFQVTNCGALKFAPKFQVSTSGKTSKANGASLTAKLSYPKVPFGSQAEIARVKVDLPKQLPSRLTTLQKACTNAQFELNPANCPKESKIGYATVTTPLLPVPLQGPAIFVSHGGEAFPSLTMVLQGYGVTIDLVGTTFISKKGITSTTFKTVPDTPFNTFELKLPQGKFSALGSNKNLCALTHTVTVKKKVHGQIKKTKKTVGESLIMPTEFVAQNGAVIHQNTHVSVTGCAKAKPAKKAKKKGKRKK
jgi:hypothetical protein